MDLLQQIVESPLYSLLFGGGGVIAIALAFLGVIKRKKKNKKQNVLIINKSEKVSITENKFNNQKIVIRDSRDTTIRKNKG